MKREANPAQVKIWAEKNFSKEKVEWAYKTSLLISIERFLNSCVFESLLKKPVKISPQLNFLNLENNKTQITNSIRTRSSILQRFELLEFPQAISKHKKEVINTPKKFFYCLKETKSIPLKYIKKSESCFLNSFSNLLLGFLLKKDGRVHGADISIYESNCASSHLSYPFPKLRSNFNFKESLRYSYENPELIDIRILAIPKNKAIFSSFKYKNSKNFYKSYFRKISSKRPELLDSYDLLPVHPWQLQNVAFIKNMILEKKVLLLPETIKGKTLLSTRTLYFPELNLDIKLSLNTTITSENRLIYQNRSHNAPIVSDILDKITTSKQLKNIEFQKDIASIRFKDFIKGPSLTAIFRDHIPNNTKHQIIPALYLFDKFAYSPKKQIPFIHFQVQNFLKAYKTNKPIDYFRKYCEIILISPIKILSILGVGLEPHLQNSLIKFKDGVPISLVLRDLDGSNINKEKLSKFIDLEIYNFYPQTWKLMRPEIFSYNRIIHSLILSHVGELISFFTRYYDIKEDILWAEARNIIKKNLAPEISKRGLANLMSQKINIKCLLKMKLNNSERFIISKISNPLSSKHE